MVHVLMRLIAPNNSKDYVVYAQKQTEASIKIYVCVQVQRVMVTISFI